MTYEWVTSRFCGTNACVEVAHDADTDDVLVRDAEHRVLRYSRSEWEAFLAAVKGDGFRS